MASENSTETPPGAEAYHGPTAASVDAAEVARFEKMAMDWWDPAGKFRPLHRFNPIRLTHIRDQAARHFGRPPLAPLPLKGLRVLDIGCGGGLLSEPLTRLGARVTGIDAGQQNIEAAKRHADASGLDIDYRHTSAEALRETSARFDLVLNMEVLEHVSDQPGFIDTVAALAAPGGMVVTATLNRTMKSFLFAILGAEYVLRWLPRGTHDWNRFVTPNELRHWLESAGLVVQDLTGMVYIPLADDWRPGRDTGVNYVMCATRPA